MKFKIPLLLIALYMFTGCALFKKAQAPPHSVYADTLSKAIVERVHLGYDDMQLSGDKSFATWEQFYNQNLYDIAVLRAYDSSRKHNAAILKLTNDWYNRLQKYENEHRARKNVNNGQVIIYQDAMDIVGKKVSLTESNL